MTPIPNVVGHRAVLEGDRVRIGWTPADSRVLDADRGRAVPPTGGPSAAAVRVAALTAALACGCAPPPSGSLTVVSLGGSYGQALVKGYLEPFTAETGVEIRLDDYNGGLAQVRAQVETGNVHWDVVDFETADAVSGCDEGLLEPIDPALLAPGPDGVPAEDDFLPGTLLECSVGTLFYSTIYAYNAERLTGGKPATLEDFFDLERFPGRRGLRRVPVANLEFALIADGVPLDEVYATLDTPAGIDRAFRKLDTIKDQVVWYDTGAQPPQMLADGEVVMSTAFNGRIFNAQNLENQPFVIVWDGQLLDVSQLAIVAGTPDIEAALDLVRFASTAASMAAVSRHIAYSPTRRSGAPLVSTHAETGVDMDPHMPAHPENTRRALQNDWAWWSDNRDDMNERFSAWLAR